MRALVTPALVPLVASVDCLVPDPANARRGDIAAIKRSLTAFGQRKPIVARRTGTDPDGAPTGIVIAGNHTLAAATELQWTHIAVIFVDDDETMAKAYALADNRTGELATWDDDQLAQTLRELSGDQFDMESLGWTNDQLVRLMQAGDFDPDPDDDAPRLDQRAPITCPQCSFEWRVGPAGEIEPV